MEDVTKLLTQKELEVFFYLLSPMTQSEIAQELQCSRANIKFHSTIIYKKLKIKGRLGLAVAFNQNQIPMMLFQMQKRIDEFSEVLKNFLPAGRN